MAQLRAPRLASAVTPPRRWGEGPRRLFASGFARQVAATYATQLAVVALNFATAVLAARLLGPAGRGQYTVALTAGVLGVQFGNLGLHASHTHHLARRPADLPRLLANSLLLSLGFGLFAAAVAGLLGLVRPDCLPVTGDLLTLVLLYVPLGLAYLLFQNLLIGLGAVAAGNALELLTNAAKVAALLLIFVAGLASVGTVVGGWLVGLALGVPWAWWQVRRRCAEPPRPSPALLRATLPYGVKAYLVALLSFLTTKVVDVYFLKRYRGLEELGQYAIAAALAQQVALFPQVLGSLIFPRLCQAGSWGRKVQLVRRALLGLVLVMVPGTLAALMLARWFIGRCFGSAFVAAAEPFAWMLPGVFLWSLESVARLLLQTDGFRPSVVGAWVVTLGVATAANAWLVPQYGMTGAAMASSLALGFLALTTAGLVTVEGARQRRQL